MAFLNNISIFYSEIQNEESLINIGETVKKEKKHKSERKKFDNNIEVLSY